MPDVLQPLRQRYGTVRLRKMLSSDMTEMRMRSGPLPDVCRVQ